MGSWALCHPQGARRAGWWQLFRNAVHGQLQERIGAEQAEHVVDALRLRWHGLTKETKGVVLKQWGSGRMTPR